MKKLIVVFVALIMLAWGNLTSADAGQTEEVQFCKQVATMASLSAQMRDDGNPFKESIRVIHTLYLQGKIDEFAYFVYTSFILVAYDNPQVSKKELSDKILHQCYASKNISEI